MLMHCNAIFETKSVNLSFKIPPICFSHTCRAPALPSGAKLTQQQLGSQPNLKTIENCHFRRCTVDSWPQWLPLWRNCTFLLKSDVPLKARLDTGSASLRGKWEVETREAWAQHGIFPVLPTSSSAQKSACAFCIISQCSVTWRYLPNLLYRYRVYGMNTW